MNYCHCVKKNEDGTRSKGSRPPKKITLNVYPGTLDQVRKSQVHQAHAAWVYVGKSNLNITMDILNSMNDDICDEDEDNELITESSRTLGRNIILTVAPHLATPEHLTKLIDYQNEYYVSLDYRYIAYLPPPDKVLEDRAGKSMTLRSILLDMTNKEPTPGTFNVFTQVDRGNTIKTGKKSGRLPSKGLTVTFKQCATEEALKAITSLPKYLEELVAPSHHHLLLPEDQAIPRELITFSSDKTSISPKFNKNADRQLKRMSKLKGSSQSRAIVPKSNAFSFAPTTPKSPPSITELRAIAHKSSTRSETDSGHSQSTQFNSYAKAVTASTPASSFTLGLSNSSTTPSSLSSSK